jgi:hypothetical protein
MPTAAEICIRAMKISGILAAGETPPADDINDVFDAFNVMVDSWSTERLFIYALQENVFPLTAGQAAYTIGPDGLAGLHASSAAANLAWHVRSLHGADARLPGATADRP